MKSRLVSLTTLLLALGAVTAQAQERTLRGTVVDSVSAAPIAGASVAVQGTDLGALTDNDGNFSIQGAPSGQLTLRVQRIGFQPKTVTLAAGQSQVTVSLRTSYLQVEELVVTGRAMETRRANAPISVGSVQGEELDRTSQETLDKALQGRVAGAVISQNSGAPGGGVQVQLRGPSSINARSAPLYVVDGVLVSNESIQPNSNAITAAATGSNPSLDQDNPVNRIADLNPKDIESIEVLKGPAAAAIYGSKAANGVVIIETKQGGAEAASWSLTTRAGFFENSNKLGLRRFGSAQEVLDAYGSQALADEWQQNSQQSFGGGVPFFDHEEELAGERDVSWEASASVNGGSREGLGYFASVLAKDDAGIIRNTGYEKQSARVNLSTGIGERFDVDFNTNLLRTEARRGLTNNGNNSASYYMVMPFTLSFVDMERLPDGTFPVNPFLPNGSNPLQTAALMDKSEQVYRFIGSSNVDWSLAESEHHDLSLQATGGVDWFGQTNDIFSPPAIHFEDADGFPGTKVITKSDNFQYNVNVNGIWNFTPSEGTTLTTSSGFQYEVSDLNIESTVGRNLSGGKDKVDAATVLSVRQNREHIEDFGFYVQEQLLTLDERLLLTASVRFDQSSANADNSKLFAYPQVAASYRFTELGGVLDEVKLRGAFGQTGNRPLFGQEFTSLELIQNIEGIPGFTIEGAVAAADLQPERQTELEGGLDIQAFDGRVLLDLTGYRQTITDLILERQLAPTSGFNTFLFNGGKLRSYGFEASLDATPVSTSDFRWSNRVSFDVNRTEVLELPVPSFVTGGFGTSLGEFRVEEGESLTQIVGTDPRPEVAGEDGLVKLGNANPDFSLGLSQTFDWKGLSLYHFWDIRPGFQVINLTQFLFDLGANSADYVDQDGTISSIPDCNPNCSGEERLAGSGAGYARQWVQDAGFAKLREVRLAWELPQDVVQSLWGRLSSARLSLSGRNLITITDYEGLDPEVSNFGQENFARNVDVAPYPPSRSFWLGLELAF